MPIQNPADLGDVEVIDTGIPALNKLLGVGGYPRKYLTMISGQAGVGKTTIAVQSIIQAQKKGIKTLYIETDYKFIPKYFRDLGVDFNKVTVLQGEVGEVVLEELLKELNEDRYGLVIVDTVSKLTPREEIEKGFDSTTIGKQAMLIGRFLRKLKPLAHDQNLAVVLLNHERENIMTQGITTPGGKAIQEDVVIWVRMSHTGESIKVSNQIIGKRVKAKIWRKNQVAPTEGHEVILEVYNGKGFSVVSDLFQDALDKKIIKKDGQMFFFGEQKLGRGQNQAREAVEKDEKLQEEIKKMLWKYLIFMLG